MFNLSDMMGKFQDMQSRLKEVKEQLDDILVESEAGGGMVRVTANANRKVLKIHIDAARLAARGRIYSLDSEPLTKHKTKN